MIKEFVHEFYIGHRLLVGDGAIFVAFIASIIAMLFLLSEKGRKIVPLFLCLPATIGCAISLFIRAVRTRQYGSRGVKAAAVLFAVCLATLAITVSGRPVFSQDLAGKSDNDMHIPGSLVQAMDSVLAECDDPKVLTMPGWGSYLESYSSAFSLMYEDPAGGDPSSLDEDAMKAYTELGKNDPDMRKLAAIAERNDCVYVILSKDLWPEKPITRYGYELVFENEGCGVYREVMTP